MRIRGLTGRGWILGGYLLSLSAAAAQSGVTIDAPMVIAEGAAVQAPAVVASRAALADGTADALVAWSTASDAVHYRRLGAGFMAPTWIGVRGAVAPGVVASPGASGNVLLSWGGPRGLTARWIRREDGHEALGPQLVLPDRRPALHQTEGSVVPGFGGRLLALWSRYVALDVFGHTAERRVIARSFTRAALPQSLPRALGPAYRYGARGGGFTSLAPSAVRGELRTLVLWHEAFSNPLATGGLDVRARFLDAFGDPLGDPFVVNHFTRAGMSHPVAVPAHRGFLVAWQSAPNVDPVNLEDRHESQDGDGAGIVARGLADDGQPVSADQVINVDIVGDQTLPALAPLDAERAVVVWRTGEQGVRARVVDRASGAPLGDELVVADQPFPIDGLGVADVGAGQVVIVWRRADRLSTEPPTLVYRLLAVRLRFES